MTKITGGLLKRKQAHDACYHAYASGWELLTDGRQHSCNHSKGGGAAGKERVFCELSFIGNLTKRHSDRNLALRICHEDSAPAAQIHALVSDRGLAPSSSEMTSNDGIPLVVSGGVGTAPAQAQADVTTTPDFCSLIPAFLMGTLCMLNIIP